VLYGCETWAVREQAKPRITLAEMKFMRRRAKYTWQDCRTMKVFCQNSKLNQLQGKLNITETNE